jgi:hypothetical protein
MLVAPQNGGDDNIALAAMVSMPIIRRFLRKSGGSKGKRQQGYMGDTQGETAPGTRVISAR